MFHLNAACRDAGSARSGDHMLLHPPERSPEGNFRAMAGVASFSKRLKVLAPLQNAGSDALVNAASPCQ